MSKQEDEVRARFEETPIEDIVWRLSDIRETLISRNGRDEHRYHLDEWSVPIKNLDAAIAKVRALSSPQSQAVGAGWIDLAEKLPPALRDVLMYHPAHAVTGGINRPRTLTAYTGTRPRDYLEDGYTHWQEIPAAPTKDQK